MVDIISLQELADAKLDAQSLGQFINGGVGEEVLTRLSQQYPTIKKLLIEFQKYNGRAYKTYAEMDVDKANLSSKTKVTVTNDAIDSNNGDWQWDGVAFTKSAYDPVRQSKEYTDVQTEKLKNFSNSDSAFEVADESGRVAFKVGNDGKTDFVPSEDIQFEKLNTNNIEAESNTDSAFEVADESGRVAFKVGNDGKTDFVPSDVTIQNIIESLETTELPEAHEPIKNYLDGQDWRKLAVAYWDFKEEATPYIAKHGREPFPLNNGSGSNVQSVIDPVMGRVARFNGSKDYLIIPAENVGKLNLSKLGDECTVLAVAKRSSLSSDFIAGMWQENDLDPRRQYGLFIDLPYYGGDDQIIGHISYSGGPTPGYPYSRDYSATARKVGTGKWRCFGLTYDGEKIISYLDGVTDSRPSYTDNKNKTYRKNPYDFDEGLCRRSVSDFTVGAVRLTAGMGNLFAGDLAAVVIFDKALSPADMLKVHLDLLKQTQPLFILDFFKTSAGSSAVKYLAMSAYYGNNASDNSGSTANICHSLEGGKCFLEKTGLSRGIVNFDIRGDINLRLSQLQKIEFKLNNSLASDVVRVCICVGGSWFVSNQAFSMSTDGATNTNWQTAEDKTFEFSRTAANWLNINFVPGTELVLGTSVNSDLKNQNVQAIGFYIPDQAGIVRISDVTIFN